MYNQGMEITQVEFIERLNKAVGDNGTTTQYRLSKDSGVAQSAISRIRNGKMPLTTGTAEKLAVPLGYRAKWSLTFERIQPAPADDVPALIAHLADAIA